MNKTLIGLAVGVVMTTTLAAGLIPTSISRAASPDAPNIIFILTDDQRIDSFDTMPFVNDYLQQDGETFTGIVPTALCCPSRTSILTGRYSHSTGIYKNAGKRGGWETFHDSGGEDNTVATALQADGYQTGMFGKYLNGWPQSAPDYVPPGWNDFMGIRKDSPKNPELASVAYYDYWLTGTQPTEWHGDSPADYSTNVLADKAVNFVRQNVSGDPFFLMFTPVAPHTPTTPAKRDIGTYHPAPYQNKAVNEKDMSDKPTFFQDLPKVKQSAINIEQMDTGESLRSVDRAVARLVNATGDELSNTLIVYMSDNGVMWGEHHLTKKDLPYKWATEVPFFMRWDNQVTAGSTGALAANIDVAPTFLDAAGIPDGLQTEGISLLSNQRNEVLLESMAAASLRPAYCGLRTQDQLFVQYSRRTATELYDYSRDPLELSNIAEKPSAQAQVDALRAETQLLCDPTPPDFAWQRHLRP